MTFIKLGDGSTHKCDKESVTTWNFPKLCGKAEIESFTYLYTAWSCTQQSSVHTILNSSLESIVQTISYMKFSAL